MKHFLCKALLFISLILSVNSINAQCSLDQVGSPNFVAYSSLSDMAVAPNGMVYTFSYNSGLSQFQLHALMLSSTQTLVATISTSTSVRPAIAISKTGKVSVLIRDENAGKVAKLYYLSGGSLLLQGTAISAGQVSDLSLAFNAANEEVVAYTDISNSNIATVKKWNGSAWVNVGTGTVSTGAAAYNSLMIDAGNFPVLAYQDATTAPANKITVKRFNGSAWVALFASANPATNAKLKLGKNSTNYFLGYTETTSASAVVQLYNGSSWSQLGSPVTNVSSAAGTFGLDIDPTDTPAFTTILSTPPYPVAYKYSGGAWNVLVSYINSSTASSTNIGYDAKGSPYYFYVDQPSNYSLNVKTTTTPVNITAQPTSTVLCNGGSMGYFYTGVVGGTPSYQWQVSSGGGFFANASTSYSNATGSSLTFNPVTALNQDVVRCVLNAGCINVVSQPATLTVNTLSVSNTFTSPSCYNTSNGAISATVTGGSTPYTYTWSPIGGNGATATGLYGTTYTLSTTDNIGCTTDAVMTLTTPPSINSSFAGNQSFCNGSSTTMTVIASGGTGALTYSWTPSINIAPTTGSVVTMNPSSSITYGVQITDATGCTATNTVGINPIPLPAVSAGSSSSNICAGLTVTLTASGSADTYTWNPGAIANSTAAVAPSTTTTYTATGTNTTTGCTNTATVTITVNPIPTLTTTASPATICAGSTTTLTGAGAVTYFWNPGSMTTSAATVSPASSTVYTLTGTSAAGCSATKTVAVTVNAIPTLTTSANGFICAGQSYTFNATGATTYTWNPGGITGSSMVDSPASTTIYTVSGATSGCVGTKTVSLNVTPLPTANAGPTRTLTCANTSTTLAGSGTGTPTYTWTGPGILSGGNTASPTVNQPGTYTLVVQSSGCTSTPATVLVSQNIVPPSPTASTTGSITCTNFVVTLNGAPATGVTYFWSGPNITGSTSTQTTTANAPGTYTLKVTSSVNGCTNTAVTNVTQNTTPPAPTASTSGILTCATTMVTLNGSPGAGVTYQWNGPGIVSGATTQNAVANAAGSYSLLVTNTTNGCTGTALTSVTQNTSTPTIIASSSQSLTCTASSVPLTASSSADPSTTYTWTSTFAGTLNNYNISNPNAFASGVYTVDVTNTNNGCAATTTVEVFSDLAVPTATVSFSPSNTLTCTDPTILAIAGTSDPNVSFSWTGSGIIAGAATATVTINQADIYSVVITNTMSGCSSTTTMSVVQDITPPALSVNAVPSTICAGNSTTLTATGANTYSWSTGQSSASITDSPSATTVYTVTGYGVNGCSDVMTQTVTVDAGPSLSVTGALAICKGSTANLSASGATSYTWNTGATTATISETPTVTTTYTVSGDNGSCAASLITTVTIVPSKDITGTITSTAGATSGDVILYKYTAALSQWDSVTTVPLTASYSFSNIDSALYVIRAMPTATNIQVTYAGSSISWQNATVITHGCTNNSTQNIQMIGLDNIGIGTGQLSGTIIEGVGFGQRISSSAAPLVPGNPIGGIIVKGGKNPGGQMFVQTTTNSSGQYTLSGLPMSTGTNDYFIFVDIPGLDTNLTYHVMITSGSPVVGNLDFYVDSMYINPVYITKVKEESSLLENRIVLYPNPANQYFSIQYELINDSDVTIDLYDMVGKKVRALVPPGKQSKDKYDHRIETADLGPGVYFVKLKLNGNETAIKLILTK